MRDRICGKIDYNFIKVVNMHSKRRILFVINPVAGKGKTIEILPIINKKLKPYEDTIAYDIQVSKNKGDISRLATKYYLEGYTEFVAVGGDGSLSELINGFEFPLVNKPSIGIIPLGTGNDFVKSLKEKNDIDEIFNAIINNHIMPIDIGRVNAFNFINVCSFGIDGPIIRDTDRLKKYLPGKSSYLISTLKAGVLFKPNFVKITADGKTYDGNMILIAIGNGKYIGGGMNICPEAKLADGYFELCMVRNVSKIKFMKEISKVYSGRLSEVKEVTYIKAKHIKIEVDGKPYVINVDGNLLGCTPAEIKIIERAVNIYSLNC